MKRLIQTNLPIDRTTFTISNDLSNGHYGTGVSYSFIDLIGMLNQIDYLSSLGNGKISKKYDLTIWHKDCISIIKMAAIHGHIEMTERAASKADRYHPSCRLTTQDIMDVLIDHHNNRNSKTLMHLVKKYQNYIDIYQYNDSYGNLVLAACYFNHLDLVKFLIEEKGVNPNFVINETYEGYDDHALTLLGSAVEGDHYLSSQELITYLLEKGANPNLEFDTPNEGPCKLNELLSSLAFDPSKKNIIQYIQNYNSQENVLSLDFK